MAAYQILKGYCSYAATLFFRDIEVINVENVPTEGPTIVYGNHNNQFIDGMILMKQIQREINFVTADVSLKRPLIGDLIKLTNAIPIKRAQDSARKGQGKITKIQNGVIYGKDTKFTQIKSKSMLKINKHEIRVDEIINDEQIKIQDGFNIDGIQQYKILPKIDYHELFQFVWQALNNNRCIGIFPEGGSHDRLQVLPFKAGICIMALGAMDKYRCQVTMVPAGFNYYNPQNFRSKVILQFGPAYVIPQEYVELYRKDKKNAISTLLAQLEKMLKSVTTQCQTFDELSTLFFCRELYTRKSNKILSGKQKLQLNRRFAKGFDKLIKQPKLRQTYQQLKKFNQFVKINGLSLITTKSKNILYQFVRLVIYFQKTLLRLVIALPGFIMMGPTTKIITYQAQKQRMRCLKKSEVKVKATDVVGSYKLLLSMLYFPISTGIHSLILFKILKKFTKFGTAKCVKICLLMFFLMPVYALIFVQCYDSLGVSWTKFKYLFMRLFKRNIYDEFEEKKRMFSRKIIQMVDLHGDDIIQGGKAKRIIKPEDIVASSTQLIGKSK